MYSVFEEVSLRESINEKKEPMTWLYFSLVLGNGISFVDSVMIFFDVSNTTLLTTWMVSHSSAIFSTLSFLLFAALRIGLN